MDLLDRFIKSSRRIKYCLAALLSFAVLCLVALNDFEDGYYLFLRIFSTFALGTSILAYAVEVRFTMNPVTFIAGTIAILYNPFKPIYLSEDNWTWIDIVSAVALFSLAVYIFAKHIDLANE